MDYEDMIPREEGYKTFLDWRKKINATLDEPRSEFFKIFEEAVKKAGEGDAICQDIVAYYYKSGVERRLDEDYPKYMHWEILSGANGNIFAIEKLQFFLGYAYDQVVASPEFPKIKYFNGIDEYNYIAIIGQRICEALVEKLNLDAGAISKMRDTYLPYAPEHFRDLRRAIDDVLPKVIENMANKNNET